MPKSLKCHCEYCHQLKKGRPVSIPVEPYNGDEVWICYDCFPKDNGNNLMVIVGLFFAIGIPNILGV